MIKDLSRLESILTRLNSDREHILAALDGLEQEYQRHMTLFQDISELAIHTIGQVQKLKDEGYSYREQMRKELESTMSYHENHTFAEQIITLRNYIGQIEESQGLLLSRISKSEFEVQKSMLKIEKAQHIGRQILYSIDYLAEVLKYFNTEKQEDGDIVAGDALALYSWIESEKTRINRDLHDGPVQKLTAAKMNIDYCFNMIQKDFEMGLLLLPSIKKDLGDIAMDVRNILFELATVPIEELGLRNALKIMIQNLLKDTNVKCKVFVETKQIVPLATQHKLYRFSQEIVTNIKKHAEAMQVVLKISCKKEYLEMLIMDDGIGFEVPRDFTTFILKQHSYGLYNIQVQVNEMGGDFKINSTRGQGSVFRIQLPLGDLKEIEDV